MTSTKAPQSLNDRYLKSSGRVFLTGTQTLVKLPLMQRQMDLRDGINSAGFISGYRGSPLGGYDLALWQAKNLLDRLHPTYRWATLPLARFTRATIGNPHRT